MNTSVNWTNVIIEFIGTFVFLSIIMNVAFKKNGGVLIPIAIGVALMASIWMFRGDCHLNPAVSFMGWCKGDTATMTLAAYVIAQLAGAFAAFAVHTYVVKV
jgi:aquaporin Z